MLRAQVHFSTPRRTRRGIVVAIAQVVEHLVVVQGVAGSSPVSHPIASGVDHLVVGARRRCARVAPVPRHSVATGSPSRPDRLAASSRNRPTHASWSSRRATGSAARAPGLPEERHDRRLGVGRQRVRHGGPCDSRRPRRRGTSPASRPTGRAAAPRSPRRDRSPGTSAAVSWSIASADEPQPADAVDHRRDRLEALGPHAALGQVLPQRAVEPQGRRLGAADRSAAAAGGSATVLCTVSCSRSADDR